MSPLETTVRKPFFNIVLVEPEIPNNTGNIGRTCVGGNAHLHLVGPLGFEISDKQLKRAGLDYWKDLTWTQHASWEDLWSKVEDPRRIFLLSAKATKSYFDVQFQEGDWLVFGKETQGLPQPLLNQYPDQTLLIPMYGPVRGFNLASSVAMVLYEGIRQVQAR
ncbi:MAG: tRNA (cytidine(34)-2'-O)-methyltransferase [Bdellovibrionales bacterium]|nr:tRNA (cytidine(34)-2'-O)-methyltransferase [Bdellovibrionales bacterium]